MTENTSNKIAPDAGPLGLPGRAVITPVDGAFYLEERKMSEKKDLSGKTFGRWTAICVSGSDKRGELLWRCHCECGKESSITGGSLRSGNSISCGCFRRENPSQKKHGASVSGTPGSNLYCVWKAMISRCENKNTKSYQNYGGRGISVCDEWRHSFETFISDMGPRPQGHSIERKDNSGNYDHGNCRWANKKEQANNTRVNRTLTIDGDSKTLTQWSEISRISVGTIWKRLDMGWPEQAAVFNSIR